jgi:hypothetical protein
VLGILSGCQSLRDLERFAIRHHSVLTDVLGVELRRPRTPRSIRSDRGIPCEWWGFGALRACRHWGPRRRPREGPCGCRRRSRRQVLGPCRPMPGLVMPSLLNGGGEGAISWEAGQDCVALGLPRSGWGLSTRLVLGHWLLC